MTTIAVLSTTATGSTSSATATATSTQPTSNGLPQVFTFTGNPFDGNGFGTPGYPDPISNNAAVILVVSLLGLLVLCTLSALIYRLQASRALAPVTQPPLSSSTPVPDTSELVDPWLLVMSPPPPAASTGGRRGRRTLCRCPTLPAYNPQGTDLAFSDDLAVVIDLLGFIIFVAIVLAINIALIAIPCRAWTRSRSRVLPPTPTPATQPDPHESIFQYIYRRQYLWSRQHPTTADPTHPPDYYTGANGPEPLPKYEEDLPPPPPPPPPATAAAAAVSTWWRRTPSVGRGGATAGLTDTDSASGRSGEVANDLAVPGSARWEGWQRDSAPDVVEIPLEELGRERPPGEQDPGQGQDGDRREGGDQRDGDGSLTVPKDEAGTESERTEVGALGDESSEVRPNEHAT
ncbi:hypothetical protein HDU96_010230 [Phlyctochytrium bullatum]|nr:hypothetical protein HDU96_010230 [Phlyctochytrium bullatum]